MTGNAMRVEDGTDVAVEIDVLRCGIAGLIKTGPNRAASRQHADERRR
jgi:hypothetical protein